MQVNCITADCVKLSDVGSTAGSLSSEYGACHNWLLRYQPLSIGRPKDKRDDDSVSLRGALGPHYIHKVDGKD
jgi:hypothetical protein